MKLTLFKTNEKNVFYTRRNVGTLKGFKLIDMGTVKGKDIFYYQKRKKRKGN
jgi:hypothetical protein